MNFRNAIAGLALLTAYAEAAGNLDYDYEDFRAWNDFTGSACNGLKNSPVAIKTKECTRYEDYALTVSTTVANVCLCDAIVLSCFIQRRWLSARVIW